MRWEASAPTSRVRCCCWEAAWLRCHGLQSACSPRRPCALLAGCATPARARHAATRCDSPRARCQPPLLPKRRSLQPPAHQIRPAVQTAAVAAPAAVQTAAGAAARERLWAEWWGAWRRSPWPRLRCCFWRGAGGAGSGKSGSCPSTHLMTRCAVCCAVGCCGLLRYKARLWCGLRGAACLPTSGQ